MKGYAVGNKHAISDWTPRFHAPGFVRTVGLGATKKNPDGAKNGLSGTGCSKYT